MCLGVSAAGVMPRAEQRQLLQAREIMGKGFQHLWPKGCKGNAQASELARPADFGDQVRKMGRAEVDSDKLQRYEPVPVLRYITRGVLVKGGPKGVEVQS